MKKLQIAIDGPSAAGKSTIAASLANYLKYTYIDTGAMYRAIAYYLIENNIALEDESAIHAALQHIDIRMQPEHRTLLNGEDISEGIRQEAISMGASTISKFPAVRSFLVLKQRELAAEGGVVLDGRDIGTVVLPQAHIKLFIDASNEARAKRRYIENIQRGLPCDLPTLTKEIIQRDKQDREREHAPLIKAADATLIDTTNMTLEQTVTYVQQFVQKYIEEGE